MMQSILPNRHRTRSGLFVPHSGTNLPQKGTESCIALIVWIPDQLPHLRISLTTQHAKQPPNLIYRISLITGVPLATIQGLQMFFQTSFMGQFQAIHGPLTRVEQLGSTITLIRLSLRVIYSAISCLFRNTRLKRYTTLFRIKAEIIRNKSYAGQ